MQTAKRKITNILLLAFVISKERSEKKDFYAG